MKLAKRIGRFAIMLDETANLSEIVDADEIQLQAFVVNNQSGIAQFSFVFGGRDSLGRFQMDYQREPAQITITREQNPDVYRMFCDENGDMSLNYDAGFFERIFEIVIPVAQRQLWRAKYPDMQILFGDRVIGT